MIGLMVLAAGGSSRFGSPKQLTTIDGETLLRRAARTAESFPGRAVIVLGAHAESLRSEIEGAGIVVNEEWQRGLATSIHAGVRALLDCEAIVIALADQPDVGIRELQSLIDVHLATGAPIVAAGYEGLAGVPALFDRSLYPALLALEGDEGAKRILRTRSDVQIVPMPQAARDIDEDPARSV